MATRDDLYTALRNADAAGDTASVQRLAAYLKSLPAAPANTALHDQIAAKIDADPISQGAMNFAKDMPFYQTFAAGYGKAGSDLVRGVGQRIGKMLPEGATKSLGLPTQEGVDEQKRLDNPLTRTTGGFTGNLIGNVVDATPAMFVPGANGLAGAAATGAVLGGLQPTATGESALKNAAIGGALGAGGAALGKGIGAGYRAAKAIAEPFTAAGPEQIAGRTLQRFAADPSTIAGATSTPTVTGALPTLAEQTGDIGIARLQDSLRSADPAFSNGLGNRLSQNNAMRVKALQDMAGIDGARDFAVANRAGTASPMYEDAFKVIPDASLLTPEQSRAMSTLMKSPAAQGAMKDAQTIAKNNGTNVGASNASGSIEGMHNMKLSMDDAISTAKAAGQTNKAKSIEAAQKQLVDLMESMSPEYKTARTVYADMSAPINQMDVAKQLLKKGASNGTELATNTPILRRESLIGALNNQPNLIKQATGRDLGGKLEDVMTPDQMNMIGAISKETDRAGAAAAAGAGPGAATAQRLSSRDILRQIISPSVAPAGAVPSLGQNAAQAIGKFAVDKSGLGLLMKGANFAYEGIASPRIQEALSRVVLSPGEAQKALDAAARADVKLPPSLLRQLTAKAAEQAPASLQRSSVSNP